MCNRLKLGQYSDSVKSKSKIILNDVTLSKYGWTRFSKYCNSLTYLPFMNAFWVLHKGMVRAEMSDGIPISIVSSNPGYIMIFVSKYGWDELY